MGFFGKSFHSEYMPQGESCGWCKNLNIYDAMRRIRIISNT